MDARAPTGSAARATRQWRPGTLAKAMATAWRDVPTSARRSHQETMLEGLELDFDEFGRLCVQVQGAQRSAI